jgi:hypothetical protein
VILASASLSFDVTSKPRFDAGQAGTVAHRVLNKIGEYLMPDASREALTEIDRLLQLATLQWPIRLRENIHPSLASLKQEISKPEPNISIVEAELNKTYDAAEQVFGDPATQRLRRRLHQLGWVH